MSNLNNNKLLFINNKKGLFKCKDEYLSIQKITRDDILTLSLTIYKNAVSSPSGCQKQLNDYIEKSTNNNIEDPYSCVIYNSVYQTLENIFNTASEIKKEINDKMLDIKK